MFRSDTGIEYEAEMPAVYSDTETLTEQISQRPDLDPFRLLAYVHQASTASERDKRGRILLSIREGKSEADIAIQLGVTKQAISRILNEMARELGWSDAARKAAGMRTTETTEQFSNECTLRHQSKSRQEAIQPPILDSQAA